MGDDIHGKHNTEFEVNHVIINVFRINDNETTYEVNACFYNIHTHSLRRLYFPPGILYVIGKTYQLAPEQICHKHLVGYGFKHLPKHESL